MTTQKTWLDDDRCKEVGLVEDFREKEEKAEVVEFPEEHSEKLADLYEDDLVIVTMEYAPGKFTVTEIVLCDEAFIEGEMGA